MTPSWQTEVERLRTAANKGYLDSNPAAFSGWEELIQRYPGLACLICANFEGINDEAATDLLGLQPNEVGIDCGTLYRKYDIRLKPNSKLYGGATINNNSPHRCPLNIIS